MYGVTVCILDILLNVMDRYMTVMYSMLNANSNLNLANSNDEIYNHISCLVVRPAFH